jgi:AcrR family transcriptional regulator
MAEIEIKERIKLAAHDLVMQYGIRSVSMDDIATQLGMSKKTIYLYFKDKDELVEAIVVAVLSKNQQACTKDKDEAENAVHEVFLAMDMMVEMFNSMNPSIIFDMQKYHPAAFQKFLLHKNDFLYNMMKHNLERGIAEELYRPEINVEMMARFRVESMLLPFNPEFLRKVKCNLLEVEQQVITHWVYGLVTSKGYKMVLKYIQQRDKELSGKK